MFLKIKSGYFDNITPLVLKTKIIDHDAAILKIIWSKPKSNDSHTSRRYINMDKIYNILRQT